MSHELCQVCGELGEDRRTLRVGYFYELTEASDKLEKNEDGLYHLRTCKDCRGEFIGMLSKFCAGELIDNSRKNPTEERNIPVRENGAVVYLTLDEYNARFK